MQNSKWKKVNKKKKLKGSKKYIRQKNNLAANAVFRY